VQPGQKVAATLDAYPDWQIPAHVITTIPAADRQKATVKVRIGFDALDPRLLPDMAAKVAFLAGETGAQGAAAQRVRLVARAAIRGEKGAEYVLVVKEGVLERRAVTVGPTASDPRRGAVRGHEWRTGGDRGTRRPGRGRPRQGHQRQITLIL
jgi:hypothetical protein